jgi:hypothetical protein
MDGTLERSRMIPQSLRHCLRFFTQPAGWLLFKTLVERARVSTGRDFVRMAITKDVWVCVSECTDSLGWYLTEPWPVRPR